VHSRAYNFPSHPRNGKGFYIKTQWEAEKHTNIEGGYLVAQKKFADDYGNLTDLEKAEWEEDAQVASENYYKEQLGDSQVTGE
jgi:hypothetical protein